MSRIKEFIDYIEKSGIDPAKETEKFRELLKNSGMGREAMNIAYLYCCPRPLEDYGLPPRIQSYRMSTGVGPCGDDSEIAFIIEACKTEQYGRFMKHIMHAYQDPENIFPVAGTETDTCCICGKTLCESDLWAQSFPLDAERHNLCFSSKESSAVLCIDCIVRLIKSIQLMNELDPGFLDWTKRKTYQDALDQIKPI